MVLLIEDVLSVSDSDLETILKANDYSLEESKSFPDCKCGDKPKSAKQPSKPTFSVFCLTISDRASKGEYPEDLSGKALREQVTGNDRFNQIGDSV